MKVMALNSSPRGDGQSKTAIMLNSLVEGMREAGAEVEVVSLSKNILWINAVGSIVRAKIVYGRLTTR